MIITVKRFKRDAKSILGLFEINGHFEAFTLEDAERCEKISGQTAIPAGTYQIKLREEDTPLTKRYRDKFPDWFKYHLQIQDVPGFEWIYIHVGNWIEDTEGCLLVGDTAVSDPSQVESYIKKSTQAFERIYKQVIDEIARKKEVWIVIS